MKTNLHNECPECGGKSTLMGRIWVIACESDCPDLQSEEYNEDPDLMIGGIDCY